ncbi:peptide MFS transporter [Georgenia yuyongxinii]|uniref:Peptide MFS transporter n=2 Tax=Georgenia yuyongxinii TaxID=2589797 RepID=A0A552WWE6_9MICO|nr:peptide MFS transporter [Georgenia yuyongxinii]
MVRMDADDQARAGTSAGVPLTGEPGGKTFFGQPRALANLFSVELWERFSFYGMQGIVLLYMYFEVTEGGLGLDQAAAAGIVGAYGGSVYLFSVLGGWVADRLVGSERTMYASAVLIMLGHISLALLPGVPGLALGLICIAVGSGGLKATITNLVGSLYAPGDTRRDAGFSIFYMGINIGGLLGPLLTGLAQQRVGFHLGFGLAAIGMAIGLIQYAFGRKNLPESVHYVPDPLPRSKYGRAIAVAVGAVAVIAVAVATGLLNPDNLADVVVGAVAVAAVALFTVLLTSKQLDADERSRVLSFIPMFIGSAAFWALFQQQFTVITIYSDTRLDREFTDLPLLGDWTMPIPWVQSFNPFFIIVLAPVFAALWTKLGDRQPTTPVKFSIGIALMGAAFLLFLPMVGVEAVPVLWIAVIMLVATLGELMLSPVGLSLATKLAPRAFPVLMVALFYLSVSLGTALSGTLAGFYSEDNEAAYFGILGAVTIGIGVILLALSPRISRLMRGIR